MDLIIDFSHMTFLNREDYLVSCAKLNFLASPRLGTVRELRRMLRSPTLMAISLRILLRLLLTLPLLTRVIENRSMI